MSFADKMGKSADKLIKSADKIPKTADMAQKSADKVSFQAQLNQKVMPTIYIY
ncbi:hypothetical protein V7266_10420 [Neobacillus drentensis]|uniref:hypothetical protein n=1 Tax=Neobacillus drentensis TaxID=220684 RepID=UPI0030001CDE